VRGRGVGPCIAKRTEARVVVQFEKVTPAMAAGVTPKLWEMSDMVKVLEDWENDTTFRGS
jgi:hypothetical protein